MKLVAVIGHAWSPGALVMTRLKSLALAQSALAAAAAKVSALGSTQLPAAFCMAVYGMPFCSATRRLHCPCHPRRPATAPRCLRRPWPSSPG
ncbi:hypothetical protein G6F62_015311 [Rhizopus arrhizus]|nr:hypothetical protein G6F62_015311 [Rhizopus arrhizus]